MKNIAHQVDRNLLTEHTVTAVSYTSSGKVAKGDNL